MVSRSRGARAVGFKMEVDDIRETHSNDNMRWCSGTIFSNYGKGRVRYTLEWKNKSEGKWWLQVTYAGD
jgi:hypothetical protein